MHRYWTIGGYLCFWCCFLYISISQSNYRLHCVADCIFIRSWRFWYSFLNSNICCCSQSVFVNPFWSGEIGYLLCPVGREATGPLVLSFRFDFVYSQAMRDLNGMFCTLGDLDHEFTLRSRWKSCLVVGPFYPSSPRVSSSSDFSSTSLGLGASSLPLYLTSEIDLASRQLSFIFFVWICRWSSLILFSASASLNGTYLTSWRSVIIFRYAGLSMVQNYLRFLARQTAIQWYSELGLVLKLHSSEPETDSWKLNYELEMKPCVLADYQHFQLLESVCSVKATQTKICGFPCQDYLNNSCSNWDSSLVCSISLTIVLWFVVKL